MSYVSVSQAAEALRPWHSQELAMGEANARGWELSRLFSLDRDDDAAMELTLPSGAELGQRLAADGDLLAAMRDVLAKMAPGQMEPPLEAEFAGVKRLLAKRLCCRWFSKSGQYSALSIQPKWNASFVLRAPSRPPVLGPQS